MSVTPCLLTLPNSALARGGSRLRQRLATALIFAAAFALGGCVAPPLPDPAIVDYSPLVPIAPQEIGAPSKDPRLHRIDEFLSVYVPEGENTSEVDLAIHLNEEPAPAVLLHNARGAKSPLLILEDVPRILRRAKLARTRGEFEDILKRASETIATKTGQPPLVFDRIEITCYGQGGGVLREWLRHPDVRSRIVRAVLMESLFIEWEDIDYDRRPYPRHVAAFGDLARDAAAATHADVSLLIASSNGRTEGYVPFFQAAQEVTTHAGGVLQAVEPNAIPASQDSLEFPLIARYDQGGLHIWVYRGSDSRASQAVGRSALTLWEALNAANAIARAR